MTARYQTIVLHVGLPKTGTTSIQGNCYRYRELLLTHGICYPSFNFNEKNIVNHSDCLIGAVLENPGKYGAAFRQGLRHDPAQLQVIMRPQLQALLAHPRAAHLVLSAESVAEFNVADMTMIRDRLAPHTRRLRVVAYIRSPMSALESMLQQRVRAGLLVEPQQLVTTVREQYQHLRTAFGDALEVVNFHHAIGGSGGLVGHFMQMLGLPETAVSSLAFTTSNERTTLEAFNMMAYINRRYPRTVTPEHGVRREPNDLHALNAFPGQPFRLVGFAGSAAHTDTLAEVQWLERELGFTFAATGAQEKTPLPPWQPETLRALEQAVRGLDNSELRSAAIAYLADEARALASTRADTSAVLAFIVDRLRNVPDNPADRVLEQLGADYFKFAALQVERASPQMALQLMTLAAQLRPGPNFIAERVQKYRRDLGE